MLVQAPPARRRVDSCRRKADVEATKQQVNLKAGKDASVRVEGANYMSSTQAGECHRDVQRIE